MRYFLTVIFLLGSACSIQAGDVGKADEAVRSIAFSDVAPTKPGLIDNYNGKVYMMGYVIDTTGAPVANAKVLFHMGGGVNPWQDLVAFTDDNGRYFIDLAGHGVPYFAVSFREGYTNDIDPSDNRGIAYLGQDFQRTSGTIPAMVMKKK